MGPTRHLRREVHRHLFCNATQVAAFWLKKKHFYMNHWWDIKMFWNHSWRKLLKKSKFDPCVSLSSFVFSWSIPFTKFCQHFSLFVHLFILFVDTSQYVFNLIDYVTKIATTNRLKKSSTSKNRLGFSSQKSSQQIVSKNRSDSAKNDSPRVVAVPLPAV